MINTKAVARRTLVALTLPATAAAFFLGSAGVADAATPFGTPGQIVQQVSDGRLDWTVPAGVSSIHLHLVGGSGADGASGAGSPGGRGGYGGFVDEDVPVKPGQAVTLYPGSAAGLSGGQTYFGDTNGGRGGHGDSHGNGGRGGAASWATVDGRIIGIAGGGGGGGGGGAVYSYSGGQGGDARGAGYSGTGAGAGSAASGNIAGSADIQHGEDQSGSAPGGSFAGGGGGGGAGWNGAGLGGGRAGANGTYGGGGGGGAAGGLSWGVDPNTSYDTRKVNGDGVIVLQWTVASTTTSHAHRAGLDSAGPPGHADRHHHPRDHRRTGDDRHGDVRDAGHLQLCQDGHRHGAGRERSRQLHHDEPAGRQLHGGARDLRRRQPTTRAPPAISLTRTSPRRSRPWR